MNKRKKALIIEDSVNSQKAISFIFRALKWDPPIIVSIGKEALQLLIEGKDNYAVIIIDYGLPGGLNGLEVMMKAKSIVNDLPPFIMITGEYDSFVAPEAARLGVSALFLKSDLHKMKILLEEMFK